MVPKYRLDPSECNRLVSPLIPGKGLGAWCNVMFWDPEQDLEPGMCIALDMSAYPIDAVDDGFLIGAVSQIVQNGTDLPHEAMVDPKEALKVLHGMRGHVVGVSVKNDGGWTDYVTVELWGGGLLEGLSAIHVRRRSI